VALSQPGLVHHYIHIPSVIKPGSVEPDVGPLLGLKIAREDLKAADRDPAPPDQLPGLAARRSGGGRYKFVQSQNGHAGICPSPSAYTLSCGGAAMFVYTAKINKRKALLFVIAFALIIALVIILVSVFRDGGGKGGAVSENSVRDSGDVAEYLASLGWKVEKEPIEVKEIVIPVNL
jgi:hypothetical protein